MNDTINAGTGIIGIEKFSLEELAGLRGNLLQTGLDQWQAVHLLADFLETRGYGVDASIVPEVLLRLECACCPPEQIQQQLERVALVM